MNVRDKLAVPALLTVCLAGFGSLQAANAPATRDQVLADYFRSETALLEDNCLTELPSKADWAAQRQQAREQLLDMLGLWPMPPKSDLKPVVTGKTEHEAFVVEKLHFQSLPGLYVTANLYLPKGLSQRAPAILYLCGHGPVITNGISYGNKVTYQHHGAWFARHGYVCLILDTVQLGEIQGLHHGTYRAGMWWWNSRGYTPAGVEAWNSVRALDYLDSRPEVDAARIGVTGRSGGGAYSWWIAAIDDRIKAAAPVAGITDLRNHVVDGVVEGHCDCMFIVNTYRWDYAQVAALTAPRPLLIVNTDSDTIFPLDGVTRVFNKVRAVYRLLGASNQVGLVIGPGPHKDTQDLQVPVFRWFNRHLKGEDPVIETAAVKLFTPEQLKVFDKLPADAVNTNIHFSFVPAARAPALPATLADWEQQRDEWLAALQDKTFAGWPIEAPPLELEKKNMATRHGLRFQAYDFTTQAGIRLRFHLVHRAGLAVPERVILSLLDDDPGGLSRAAGPRDWTRTGQSYDSWVGVWQHGFANELREELAARESVAAKNSEPAAHFAELRDLLQKRPLALGYFAPRGIGLDRWSGNERKQAQFRRRFMLLGQTLDSMRIWDIRRVLQAARSSSAGRNSPIHLHARGWLAADAVYAAAFESSVAQLELWDVPSTHMQGPDLLNVLRILDLPQAMGLALDRCRVHLHSAQAGPWDFTAELARNLSWEQRFQLEAAPAAGQ